MGKNPQFDVLDQSGIVIEEVTDTEVNAKQIASTYKTAKIRMITDEIEIFKNHKGRDTPFLIVARATLDGDEYAALFDTVTKKGYIVGVERKNGIIYDFRNLDGLFSDEEWAVINEFFQQNHVFELNRIIRWTWNSRLNPRLNKEIPNHVLEKWGLDPKTMKRKR